MPWHALPRDLLEQQLEAFGFEKTLGYETGVLDTEENMERLTDYSDLHERPEDDLGPEYEERFERRTYQHRRTSLPPNACPGSRQPLNGDTRLTSSFAICSLCGQQTYIYQRKSGPHKNAHLLESEGDARAAPSMTN